MTGSDGGGYCAVTQAYRQTSYDMFVSDSGCCNCGRDADGFGNGG